MFKVGQLVKHKSFSASGEYMYDLVVDKTEDYFMELYPFIQGRAPKVISFTEPNIENYSLYSEVLCDE